MTEYDFSQEAYKQHIATQTRVSNWVTQTEEQRPGFGSALELQPGISRSGLFATNHSQLVDLPKPRPISPRRFRSSDSLTSFVLCQEGDLSQWQDESVISLNGPPRSRSPHHVRSQPQSRSRSRHRSPSHHQASQAQNANLPAGYNLTATPKYVYAPAGSRVVIIPPSGQNVSVVLPSAAQSPYCTPLMPAPHVRGPIYPPSSYPQPMHNTHSQTAQIIYPQPPSSYVYPHAIPQTQLQEQERSQVFNSDTFDNGGRIGRDIKKNRGSRRSKSEVRTR